MSKCQFFVSTNPMQTDIKNYYLKKLSLFSVMTKTNKKDANPVSMKFLTCDY